MDLYYSFVLLFAIVFCQNGYELSEKHVELTPLDDSSNGAITTILIPDDVTTTSTDWSIIVSTQQYLHMSVSLNKSWGFDALKVSTMEIQINGSNVSSDATDLDVFVSFSVANMEYLSLYMRMDNTDYNIISTNHCDISTTAPSPELQSGNVLELSNDTDGTRKDHIFAGSMPDNNDRMQPVNYNSFNNKFPLQFKITNDPINEFMFLDYTNPFINETQSCGFGQSWTPNQGFDIYIAGDDSGEHFQVESVEITYTINETIPYSSTIGFATSTTSLPTDTTTQANDSTTTTVQPSSTTEFVTTSTESETRSTTSGPTDTIPFSTGNTTKQVNDSTSTTVQDESSNEASFSTLEYLLIGVSSGLAVAVLIVVIVLCFMLTFRRKTDARNMDVVIAKQMTKVAQTGNEGSTPTSEFEPGSGKAQSVDFVRDDDDDDVRVVRKQTDDINIMEMEIEMDDEKENNTTNINITEGHEGTKGEHVKIAKYQEKVIGIDNNENDLNESNMNKATHWIEYDEPSGVVINKEMYKQYPETDNGQNAQKIMDLSPDTLENDEFIVKADSNDEMITQQANPPYPSPV